jgi:hypothetical protein
LPSIIKDSAHEIKCEDGELLDGWRKVSNIWETALPYNILSVLVVLPHGKSKLVVILANLIGVPASTGTMSTSSS